MSNLLVSVSARPGVSVAAYASQAACDAAIEEGARRSVSALRSELTASAERFSAVQLAIVLLMLASGRTSRRARLRAELQEGRL